MKSDEKTVVPGKLVLSKQTLKSLKVRSGVRTGLANTVQCDSLTLCKVSVACPRTSFSF